ncbi:MAG TPA: 2,3,4,5-tetrahydropyridine-2,6-dicarboxylate N-succinyltransferase [Bdellovibrionota bacterium]|nr:2,3,4,5-tetrahydropyridine-2,6-dicarboxylate N-succinyltransferase [Bdellovibrionota bacterium]
MRPLIEAAFADASKAASPEVRDAVEKAIAGLDDGSFRVCSKEGGAWVTHQWLKMAILLYFRQRKMEPVNAGDLSFFDKVPLKKWTGSEGVRVVPSALVRRGAFVENGAILMPSYVNIGARVGSGTMVDTWATVGSCAQVGSNVHLSGGVGIGGVLEPVQASPVIIEDHVFVGSRCIVVEGAVVEEGAVLGAGVVITASTKIIDVTGSKPVEYRGRVPRASVVIPGTLPKTYPAGEYGVPCALIVGQRSEKTDKKTSLTDALREHGVSA